MEQRNGGLNQPLQEFLFVAERLGPQLLPDIVGLKKFLLIEQSQSFEVLRRVSIRHVFDPYWPMKFAEPASLQEQICANYLDVCVLML